VITGEMIADAARKYVGAPVVEGGRSREGIDCVGLVLGVAHDLGLWMPQDVTGYGLNAWLHPRTSDAVALMRQYMVQTHKNGAALDEIARSAQVGDVVFFGMGRIAISLGIISAIDKAAPCAIQKIIGGLEVGSRFTEYDFVIEKSHAIAACFRFRMKN
jgi:cell wall-associated NlpC family hydrolase